MHYPHRYCSQPFACDPPARNIPFRLPVPQASLRLILTLGTLGLVCALLTISHIGWAQRPLLSVPPHPVPVESASDFRPHVPPKAIAYQRSSYVLGLFDLVWGLVVYAIMLRSGFAARLRDRVYRWAHASQPEPGAAPSFRATLLFYLCFSLLVALWSLPMNLAGWALEQRYGFSRQTTWGFVRDFGTTLAFTQLNGLLIWAALKLYARAPRTWWFWLWLLLIPLLLFEFILQPIVVAPAYNRFRPLGPGKLRDDILALATRAGISGARVLVSDTSRRTTHINAYVTGIGPTTRIVINDTAIRALPEDQLLAMVGHEMGHYVEKHIWIQCIGSILGAGVFLRAASLLLPWLIGRFGKRWKVRDLTDLAAVPLIILVLHLFLLVQYPIANAESRYLEHRADVFGLRLTGLNVAMARLFVGFAERDYTDPDPPALLQFWFGTHPTLKERIAFARSYRR